VGIALIELMAYLGDNLSFSIDRMANEAYLIKAQERKNVRSQLRSRGYKMRGHISSEGICRIRTLHDKDVYIPRLLQLVTDEDPEGMEVYFATHNEYDEVLLSESYVDVPVYQGEVVKEKFGYNNITDRGFVRLEHKEVGENTVEVLVDGEKWERVDDAPLSPDPGRFFSIEYDKHDNVYIQLYLGWPNFVDTPEEVELEIRYLVSKGFGGNVGSHMIKNVVDEVFDIEGNEVSDTMLVDNVERTIGGQDPEDIEEAKKRGIDFMKTMWTLVTLEDYEIHSRYVPGVANSLALDWRYNENKKATLTYTIKSNYIEDLESGDEFVIKYTDGSDEEITETIEFTGTESDLDDVVTLINNTASDVIAENVDGSLVLTSVETNQGQFIKVEDVDERVEDIGISEGRHRIVAPDEAYVVDLYIVPDDGGKVPSSLENVIGQEINQRRVSTLQVNIKDTDYYPIDIEVNIRTIKQVSQYPIEEAVEEALNDYFHPSNRKYSELIRYTDLLRVLENAHHDIVTCELVKPYSNLQIHFGEFPTKGDVVVNFV